MSNTLDPHVASVLDQAGSDDEDALIASLEDSPAMDAFREQRIQQLHSEFTRAKAQKTQGFGNYTEIKEEKALMDLTTEVKCAVVQILPCVLAFIDGAVVDRIVGFEGLGYTPDTFTTKDLESRLLSSGVVKRQTTSTLYADKAAKKQEVETDDDDDWN
ncbi:putative thioredoxin domain-containing protein [Rutstroemia sp. NJR-2017a WRK4]|nr:putative thioredoxin domain-containing protein [Rutstroemia sp. NJR-2017a WRK4]